MIPSSLIKFFVLSIVILLTVTSGQPQPDGPHMLAITPEIPFRAASSLEIHSGNEFEISVRCSTGMYCRAVQGIVRVYDSEAINTGGGYLTIYPPGGPRPVASNLNWPQKRYSFTSTQFLVKVAPHPDDPALSYFKIYANEHARFHIDIYATFAYADEVYDQGHGFGFWLHPLPSPVRIIETREEYKNDVDVVNAKPIPEDVETRFYLTAGGQIPADAEAVSFTAALVAHSGQGKLDIWSHTVHVDSPGFSRPIPSVSLGAVNPNEVTEISGIIRNDYSSELDAHPSFEISVLPETSVDMALDVDGYYHAQEEGGYGLTLYDIPVRRIDTRGGDENYQNVGDRIGQLTGEGDERAWEVCTRAGNVAVITLTTVSLGTAQGFVKAWPDGSARPGVSQAQVRADHTATAIGVQIRCGSGGRIRFMSNVHTDIIVDIVGEWTPLPKNFRKNTAQGLVPNAFSKPTEAATTSAAPTTTATETTTVAQTTTTAAPSTKSETVSIQPLASEDPEEADSDESDDDSEDDFDDSEESDETESDDDSEDDADDSEESDENESDAEDTSNNAGNDNGWDYVDDSDLEEALARAAAADSASTRRTSLSGWAVAAIVLGAVSAALILVIVVMIVLIQRKPSPPTYAGMMAN